MSLAPLRVHFISVDKDLPADSADSAEWERLLKTATNRRNQILCKPKAFGIRDPYMDGDLHIHLGLPLYGAVPWAYVNWLWLGHTSWSDVWDGYLQSLDAVWFKGDTEGELAAEALRSRCREKGWVGAEEKVRIFGEEVIMSVDECCGQVSVRKPTRGLRHLPPVLEKADCPPISIITPTFQRKKLMEIAYHNLLSTDYPLDKIEWIVVEDAPIQRVGPIQSVISSQEDAPIQRVGPIQSVISSQEDAPIQSVISSQEDAPAQAGPTQSVQSADTPHVMKDSLATFQQTVPTLQIRYIPLDGRRSIGEKRNIGIAAASHEWILFMDDDDHYPPTSFRRRIAWLLKGIIGGKAPRISCCTTIALYDLKRGISAVNVPPVSLPLAQRVSEATLAFHRSVWEERPFPEVSIAEGELWIQGREGNVIEIPPQQVIVAFTHDGNQSSRRLPPNQPPACFWNFPKEYLTFIHGLVGVEISF